MPKSQNHQNFPSCCVWHCIREGSVLVVLRRRVVLGEGIWCKNCLRVCADGLYYQTAFVALPGVSPKPHPRRLVPKYLVSPLIFQ